MSATPIKANQYYFMYGEEQLGPYSEVEIRNLFDLGSIAKFTKIWCQDEGDWCNLEEIPEFHSLVTKD